MNSESDVERYARQRLTFLEREHGLAFQQEGRSPVTVLRYLGGYLGFEVQLEWREAIVDVLVVRLRDGALPPPGNYYMYEGNRTRWGLTEVIAASFPAQHGRLRELFKVKTPDRIGRMKRGIDSFAAVLEEVAGDVLRRGEEVVEAVDP
jgi:hypothetical protein